MEQQLTQKLNEQLLGQLSKCSIIGPKKIRIHDLNLECEDMKVIRKILIEDHTIRSLELFNCKITEDEMKKFIDDMVYYNLTLIQLVMLGINDNIIRYLKNKIIQECSSLKKIDLSCNKIGPLGAKYLCDALEDSGLEIILVGKNNIGSEGMVAFSNVLKKMGKSCSLKVLDIRQNHIPNDAMVKFLDFLPDSNINTIQLDNNNLSLSTIDKLCQILPNSCLECIYIGFNNLDDTSIKKISNVINQTILKKISFQHNLFTDEGIELFCSNIKKNTTLTHLDFRFNNKMTDKSGVYLLDSIKCHYSLKNIDMHDTQINIQLQNMINQKLNNLHSNLSMVIIYLIILVKHNLLYHFQTELIRYMLPMLK